MSAPAPNPPQHSAPVSYSQGQPVALDQAEKALAALWRQAGEDAAADGSGGLTRACLWNLVVYQPSESGETRVKKVDGMLAEAAPGVPSRTSRLTTRPAGEKPAGAGDVQCWVSTLCHVASGGKRQVSTEEIRLTGYGDAGGKHFPALVRALLVPDLPVALVWLGALPHRGRLLGQLLNLSDRILVDTQTGGGENALTDMKALVEETQAYFIDLGWMRLNPVRYLLAGLFDPPGQAELLQKVESLRVEAAPAGRNTGLLMLGWLLSRLGAPSVKVAETGCGSDDWRWNAKPGASGNNGGYAVEFSVREGEGGHDGLLAVEIRAGGKLFALYQVDALHVALESPLRNEQRLPLYGWSDPELLVAGLSGPGTDPLYAEALQSAARLVEAQAWNR